MTAPRIEQAGTKNRFTEAELRANVAAYKKRMAVPGAAEREERAVAQARAKGKARGTKFPSLAKRSGTAPSIEAPSVQHARLRLNLSK